MGAGVSLPKTVNTIKFAGASDVVAFQLYRSNPLCGPRVTRVRGGGVFADPRLPRPFSVDATPRSRCRLDFREEPGVRPTATARKESAFFGVSFSLEAKFRCFFLLRDSAKSLRGTFMALVRPFKFSYHPV